MEYHGTDYSVKFRYVWARPKHKDNMKFHIAKQYEGTLQLGSANLFGKTYFVAGKTYFVGCSFYGSIWGNHQVETREFKNMPSYYYRCDFCSNNLEDFEAEIYKVKDKDIYGAKDEEDITIEEKKPKKSKLVKSHMECVKCPLKYTMNNTTYLPEGGEVEVFSEFTGGGRQAHIYRCTCGHPLVIRIAGTVQIWSKVIIGRPIVVI